MVKSESKKNPVDSANSADQKGDSGKESGSFLEHSEVTSALHGHRERESDSAPDSKDTNSGLNKEKNSEFANADSSEDPTSNTTIKDEPAMNNTKKAAARADTSKINGDTKIVKDQNDEKLAKDAKEVRPKEKRSNPEQEAYFKLRASLKNMVNKKAKIDQELETIEDDIIEREDAYLMDASAGNVVKGFDQYTKSSQTRRKTALVETDRVFSQSNTAFDAEQ